MLTAFEDRKKVAVLAQIHSLLSPSTKIPVGITYCHESLLQREVQNCPAGHSSVIIGQRFDNETNTCEYLVRDSYGNPDMKNQIFKYAWPNDKGSLWVPEKNLVATITSLTWIPTESLGKLIFVS